MIPLHQTRAGVSSTNNLMTAIQHKHCLHVTEKISNMPIAFPFLYPVNLDEIPEYGKIIQKPCDLSLVMDKLKKSEYASFEEWKNDMNLIWKNAQKFNKEGDIYYQMATELSRVFKEMIADIPRNEIDEWIIKIKKVQNKCMKLIESGQYRNK